MARRLKPQKVKDFHDAAHDVTYPVFLDRDELFFYVEPAPDVRIKAGSVDEVVGLLKEKLSELLRYDWKQVVVVDGPDEDRDRAPYFGGRDKWLGSRIEFKFRRCERSPHPDPEENKLVERKHFEDLPDGLKSPRSAFDKRGREDWERGRDSHNVWTHGSTDIVLPYTPELWDRLLRVKEVLDRAHLDLDALLRVGQENKAAFVAVLAGGGPRLLGAGVREVPLRRRRRPAP